MEFKNRFVLVHQFLNSMKFWTVSKTLRDRMRGSHTHTQDKERERFPVLTHFPNGQNSRSWVRLKPATNNSIQVYPVYGRGPNTWTIMYCLPGCPLAETRWQAEVELAPGSPVWDRGISRGHWTHYAVMLSLPWTFWRLFIIACVFFSNFKTHSYTLCYNE